MFYFLFDSHKNWAFKILVCLPRKGNAAPVIVYDSFKMNFIYVIQLNNMQKDDVLVQGK